MPAPAASTAKGGAHVASFPGADRRRRLRPPTSGRRGVSRVLSMDDADHPYESFDGSTEGRRSADPATTDLAGELLSPSEFDVWRVFVASSRLLVGDLDRRLQHEVGIPHSWFILLVVLSERPGRTARQTDLASITDFSLSRLSHAVNRLEDKGWVRRKVDQDDRRAANVVLTDLGAAVMLDIRRWHDAALRQIFFAPLVDCGIEGLRTACRTLLQRHSGAPRSLAAERPEHW